MHSRVIYIDVPDGYKYGFPKILPRERQDEIHQWIIEQGYPKELMDSKTFYVRWWEQEEGVDEQRL